MHVYIQSVVRGFTSEKADVDQFIMLIKAAATTKLTVDTLLFFWLVPTMNYF